MRALIVDDSRFIRDYLKSLLVRRGLDCRAAENGQAGLACLDCSGPYDVALVDWNMPVMDGLEMVRAVRREPALDRLKILMVTTQAENSYIAAALNAGADEYLMKPFDEAGLIEKLAMIGVLH
ncbi:MAG TPA: response regulator [Acidobacteriaceae bacterium]|nr:response regulator [Acidobacteriaceae bacterium]